ncbi:MAG TPA: VWA domain-containing protein [Pyrinomonadaceae bacterium]|nr:VWA domain-containing protein [Pyrinomonadaceae bacterium]
MGFVFAFCLFLAAVCPGARVAAQEKEFKVSLKRPAREDVKKTEAGGQGTAEAEDEDEVVRVETSLVACDVLVMDKSGRAVTGLTAKDFVVTEEGVPQEIGTFSLGDNARLPRSIILIIDYSGSQLPFIENSVKAAQMLVEQLNPRDRMAIVTDDVELLVEFTRDKKLLKDTLEALKKKAKSDGPPSERLGRSQQYTALLATLNEMFEPGDTRPIVIFQTDGDELTGLRDNKLPWFTPHLTPEQLAEVVKRREAMMRGYSLADIYRVAERSRATVYTVVPGVKLIGLEAGEEPKKLKALRERLFRRPPRGVTAEEWMKFVADRTRAMQLALFGLSKVTGGWMDYLEEPDQARAIYARILSDINRRYVIGFYPSNKLRDGKRRALKIEVRDHPDYTVWGRKSYYAPDPE